MDSVSLGVALVLTTAVARGQDGRQPASDSFRVTWQPRATGVVPTIEGARPTTPRRSG